MTELLSLMFLTPYTYLDLNKSAFFFFKNPQVWGNTDMDYIVVWMQIQGFKCVWSVKIDQ